MGSRHSATIRYHGPIMTSQSRPGHRHVWSGLSSDDPENPIGLLGVAYDGAASFRRGASDAPQRIRSLTPHVAPTTELGAPLSALRIRDYGDVVPPASQINSPEAQWNVLVSEILERADRALDHPFSIFLGGDHSVTIPLAQAAARRMRHPIGLIHIDAHLDLMDTYEGRPWSHACTARRVLETEGFSPAHAAFLGTRSWLGEEAEYVSSHPEVAVYTALSMDEKGVQACADEVAVKLSDCASVYLTLDIDALDPSFAPGTGTPEAGGLSTRDLLRLLRGVMTGLPVRALDLVEVCPRLDVSDITSFAAIKVIYEALGWKLDSLLSPSA